MHRITAAIFFALTTWAMMGAAPARLTPKEKALAKCRLMCLEHESARAEQCRTLEGDDRRRCQEDQRADGRECEKRCDRVESESAPSEPDVQIDYYPPPPGTECRLSCMDDDISRHNYCKKLGEKDRKRCLTDSEEIYRDCLARCRRHG